MNGKPYAAKVGDEDRRAWDWRQGMKKDASVEDVILMLKLGISKEIGRVWL
jgi:hypothetical protein